VARPSAQQQQQQPQRSGAAVNSSAASRSNFSAFDLSDDDDPPPPRRHGGTAAAAMRPSAASSGTSSSVSSRPSAAAPAKPAKSGVGDDDFDDDIQSLLSEMDSAMSPSALQPTKLHMREAPKAYARTPAATAAAAAAAVPAKSKPFSQRSKCFPTLVSPLASTAGCSHLLCTSCDQPVLSLRGQAWRDDVVDYLFFRNHYPDETRLRAGLQRDATAAAYACQCSWQSIGTNGSGDDTLSLSSLDTADRTKRHGCSAWNALRWICAGH
jgi:hypothetical protein